MLELAADQVGHQDQARVGAVAARSSFGRLDQAIHRPQEAIAQAAAEVAENAVEVASHGLAQALEGRQPAGLALGLEVDRALGRAEVEAGDGPRGGQAKRLREELFHPTRLPAGRRSGKAGLPHQTRWSQ